MPYSELCAADTALLGTGRGNCGKVLGYDKRYFLAKPGFTFADADAAKLEANWDAAVAAKNIYPFPEVVELEPQNVEATYYETPSGKTFRTKVERRKTMYKFIENIANHAAMKSYDNQGWDVFFLTELGYLRAHTNEDGSVRGLPLSNFYVNAQETSTIDSNPEQTATMMEFNNVDDWDKEYFVAKISGQWLLNLEGIYELQLKPATATAGATFVFEVDIATAGDNVAVDGLVVGDVELFDAAGAEVTIDTLTPDGTVAGRYTVTATDAMTSGTFGLKGVVTKADILYQSQKVAVSS